MAVLETDVSRILPVALFAMLIGLLTLGCDRKKREIPELPKPSDYQKIFADIDRAEVGEKTDQMLLGLRCPAAFGLAASAHRRTLPG